MVEHRVIIDQVTISVASILLNLPHAVKGSSINRLIYVQYLSEEGFMEAHGMADVASRLCAPVLYRLLGLASSTHLKQMPIEVLLMYCAGTVIW